MDGCWWALMGADGRLNDPRPMRPGCTHVLYGAGLWRSGALGKLLSLALGVCSRLAQKTALETRQGKIVYTLGGKSVKKTQCGTGTG